MDPITLGVVALMGAAATIAGAAEDLESDIGSQSNPNSQVQLAPQMGHLHRMMNKAMSGEPVTYGTFCGIAGAVTFIALTYGNIPILFALGLGAVVGTLLHVVFTMTSHLGRIVSQSQFEQPLFMDVLSNSLGPIAGHAFIVQFCMVALSYLMITPFGDGALHSFALPLLSVLWGVTIGAIGSSTGDVHYGAENEYQQYSFGSGIAVAIQGDITRNAEVGAKNSQDVVNFCAKYGGPLTGLCFGAIVFLSFWLTLVFGLDVGQYVGLLIILLLIVANFTIENFARKKYGPYDEE